MINTRRPAPVSTSTLPRLLEAMNDPRSSAKRVTDVVANDPALSARVLALANSAQFGLSHRVLHLNMAITLIGSNMLQTLAIASASSLLDPGTELADVREHSIAVGCASRLLAPWGGVGSGDAFAAGLLHDVGELLLWQHDPTDYGTLRRTFVDHEHQLAVEYERYGATHATIGADHLREWNVPESLARALAGHGGPWPGACSLGTVVAAAEAIVDPDAAQEPLRRLGPPAPVVDGIRADLADEVASLSAVLLQAA